MEHIAASDNPLYEASDIVRKQLEDLEGSHTNATEKDRGNLKDGAEFLRLVPKANEAPSSRTALWATSVKITAASPPKAV